MNKGFLETTHQGVTYLEISSFLHTGLVQHGFSTRIGGVSLEPYSALNLAAHVGDNLDHVCENRQLFSDALGINSAQWVTCKQVHGDQVHLATANDRGRGAVDYESSLDYRDALITKLPRVPLATFYADCVPIFILDQATPAIGLAHAGWKGTVAKIAQKTIQAMKREFGTVPSNCLVGIGPSIGPCCYEVDEAVMLKVREAFPRWQQLVRASGLGKWYINLWEANRSQLIDVGVKAEHISIAGACTSCETDKFFSYRAEQGVTGRMGAVLMLK